MGLIYQRRFTRQPQGPVQIDRSNPLGAKVITHFPFTPYQKRGTRGETVSLAGTGTYAPSERGLSVRGVGGGGVSIPLDLSLYQQITLACSFFWPTYANNDQLLMEFTANFNNAPPGGFLFNPNSSAASAFEVGARFGATPSIGYSSYKFTRPSAGVWHRFLIQFNPAVNPALVAVYIDGVSQALTVVLNTWGGSAQTFANSTLYIFSRNNASLFATAQIEGLTIYRGVLTAGEVLEDYRNPYQIIRPHPRQRFAPSADGFRARYYYDMIGQSHVA